MCRIGNICTLLGSSSLARTTWKAHRGDEGFTEQATKSPWLLFRQSPSVRIFRPEVLPYSLPSHGVFEFPELDPPLILIGVDSTIANPRIMHSENESPPGSARMPRSQVD